MASDTLALETARDTIVFARETGKLLSLRSRSLPGVELLAGPEIQPAFTVQFLDHERRFHDISSDRASDVQVGMHTHADGSSYLTARFHRLEGLDVDAEVVVRAHADDRFSRWSIMLRNDAGLRITLVQFPFIVLRYGLGDVQGTDQVLWPLDSGWLVTAPQPQDLSTDAPPLWRMTPENGDVFHYPGLTFAQFLAYVGGRTGVYAACEDSGGAIKLIRPVHHEPGLRLGFAHVGDWPERGERALGYDVVLGSFDGDWYAAAELYRQWSLQQPWAQRPLHRRTDMPAWLLDSPPHVILRIQGELDDGPAPPNEQFLPYTKTLPLLDALSARIEAPLVPVIMSWERPGPWVYPDCFPPAGGFESLCEFAAEARKRGWPVGTFCNGSRWVVGHQWTGYGGEDYYHREGGERAVCRTHEQEPWREAWDASWRPSYPCCLAAARTREIALDFVQTLLGTGLDWVQFFDQNVGAATFPCFAEGHHHPPAPGAWMTEAMHSICAEMAARGRAACEQSGGGRVVAFSVECPPNEHMLHEFQLCDVRVRPPGYGTPWVPLFHFLYHEFLVMQGGFGHGPEPYHLQIRNAYNLVIGEIPGAVMTGDGRLLNADTINWAPWEPPIGDNDASVAMLRSATALRRGPARDWLVFGRMERPSREIECRQIEWRSGDRRHSVPAVFHAAWRAPDGSFAVALANWTTERQAIRVQDDRLGRDATAHLSARTLSIQAVTARADGLPLVLPPLSCVLLLAGENAP